MTRVSNTPARNVRVHEDVWAAAKAKAAADGTTVAAVIVAALEAYTGIPTPGALPEGESVGVALGRASGHLLTEHGLRLDYAGDGTFRLSTDEGELVLDAGAVGFLEQLFTRQQPR